jgi:nucleoside-diphosphate kinase
MKEERTLVLIKPDGLVKSLTGNIITMLSETKLKIVGAKIVKVSRKLAEKHYGDLKKSLIKKFGEKDGNAIFENTLEYIQGKFHTDRVLALVYKGEDAVKKVRELAGETNPEKAPPTSIRGKYGRIHSQTKVFENVIHCSDSAENAEREIALWFKKGEVVE